MVIGEGDRLKFPYVIANLFTIKTVDTNFDRILLPFSMRKKYLNYNTDLEI